MSAGKFSEAVVQPGLHCRAEAKEKRQPDEELTVFLRNNSNYELPRPPGGVFCLRRVGIFAEGITCFYVN